MALKDMSPRNLFLFFVGMGITMLFIKAVFLLPTGAYSRALMLSAVGAGVAFAFFRRRMVILAIIALSFVLVNFGMTAIFHPTLLGTLCSAGAAAGLYLIVRWHAGKYPHLTSKDWQTLFGNQSNGKS